MAPPDRRISRRRAAVSFERAQMGDASMGDAAGRDIRIGADPDELVDFLRDYQHRLERDLAHLSDQLAAFQIMVNRQFTIDAREREERRHELDKRLSTIDRQLEGLGRFEGETRRWLAAMVIALLVVAGVVVAVVWRDLAASAGRAAYDLALLALALRR